MTQTIERALPPQVRQTRLFIENDWGDAIEGGALEAVRQVQDVGAWPRTGARGARTPHGTEDRDD